MATDVALIELAPVRMPIASIQIGNRFRHDMGDIARLAASIKEHGLLYPVVITPSHDLVAGQRRLLAVGQLGWSDVPATVLDFADLLAAQYDENVQRLDFTVSEKVAIGQALTPVEEAAAKERVGGRPPKTSARSADVSKAKPKSEGESRKRVAKAVGTSAPTLEKATEVVEAAKADPSLAPIVEQMDAASSGSYACRQAQSRLWSIGLWLRRLRVRAP
jgi:ParB family chromosome partitioning protein